MKRQTGFTLLELMVTISVAAILIAVGVPGMQKFVQNNRRAAEVNNLVATLQVARTEAVSRNQRVGICASTTGTSCSGSTSWETGWIVFVDDTSAGTQGARDAAEEILRVDAAVEGMTARASFESLAYRPNGRIETYPGNGNTGEITLCDGRGAGEARVVQIEMTGRPDSASVLLDGSSPSCPS